MVASSPGYCWPGNLRLVTLSQNLSFLISGWGLLGVRQQIRDGLEQGFLPLALWTLGADDSVLGSRVCCRMFIIILAPQPTRCQ